VYVGTIAEAKEVDAGCEWEEMGAVA